MLTRITGQPAEPVRPALTPPRMESPVKSPSAPRKGKGAFEGMGAGEHGTGRSVPASDRPLTARQKKALVSMARRAFDHLTRQGMREDFSEWRHDQQLEAVNKSSLRDCVNRDYRPLRGHFLSLAGDASPRAFADMITGADDTDQGGALRLLRAELHRVRQDPGMKAAFPNGAEGYLITIARNKVKNPNLKLADIFDLPARKIWELIYTLRNRLTAILGGGRNGSRGRNRSTRKSL